MGRTWVVVLLIALAPLKGFAKTIPVSSCSQADVQEAVNAASDGDTVAVPAGTCVWTSQVNVPDTKGLTLQGAGVDQTTITGSGVFRLLRVNLRAGNSLMRVTGFTMHIVDGDVILLRNASALNAANAWRIDHNNFTDGRIWVNCYCYGVIDHNVWQRATPYSTIRVMENSYDSREAGFPADGGAASWRRAVMMGTRDAVYIEDNIFDFSVPGIGMSAIDGRSGGRAVFRYNTVINIPWGTHDAEIAHERGMRQLELYRNNFHYTDVTNFSTLHRGGTGVVWGNRFKAVEFTQADTPFVLRITRGTGGEVGRDPWEMACVATSASDTMCFGGPPRSCAEDADCSGDFSPPCVRIDGTGSDGYPCRDQIGAGLSNATTGAHDLEPLYFWDNYHCYGTGGDCDPEPPDGTASTTISVQEGTSNQLQDGRDFYSNTKKPGYIAFTYPHPLVTQNDIDPPGPPRNLRFQ